LNVIPQVPPISIVALDQLQLPDAVPFLELFFTRNRGRKVGVQLESDESRQDIAV
jgi:hypothetical protein